MSVRMIQVGMGGWGRNWARSVIPKVRSATTVAWVDASDEALHRAQVDLGVPAERCFRSVEEALAEVDADAVLITTFLEGHAPVALAALKAGKHVLVEKPFAESLASARRVVDAARRRSRLLMVSQNYRFHPAPHAVRALIEKGTLGPVGTVHIDFRRFGNKAPVGQNKHYTIWHPLLADMSIHHFDLMRMVLGQHPKRVECRTWHPPWSRFTNPPAGAATIEFDGGAVVSYRGSWVSPDAETSWAGAWRMECEKGVIEWSSRGTEPDAVVIHRPGRPSRPLPLPKRFRRDREGSLVAFARAVEKGGLVPTPGRDNLQTLALTLAAIESADTGKAVVLSRARKGKGAV